jgi:hypothetical protein
VLEKMPCLSACFVHGAVGVCLLRGMMQSIVARSRVTDASIPAGVMQTILARSTVKVPRLDRRDA